MEASRTTQECSKKNVALEKVKSEKCSGHGDENETAECDRSDKVNGSHDINNGRCAEEVGGGRSATLRAGSGQDGDGLRNSTDEDRSVETKTEKIRALVEQSASEESKITVNRILAEVKQLPDIEKLLLYVQLPTGSSVPVDPHRQIGNPLGNRFEITQTITWIKTHLEEDSEVSLQKHEVYEDYTHYCSTHNFKPLSTADFGKVMKHVFPTVRPRRLGTRGNSKYCYSGLRKKIILDVPKLPDVTLNCDNKQDEALALRGLSDDDVSACSYVILEWAFKLLEQKFDSIKELACYLVKSNIVDGRSVGAFTVLSLLPNKEKGPQASALLGQSGGNKHRETQLQLQRKLQEKEMIREQKKKLQELKAEKTSKERKRTASGPCGRSSRQLTCIGNSIQHPCSQPATPLPCSDSPPLQITSHKHLLKESPLAEVLVSDKIGATSEKNFSQINGKQTTDSLAITSPLKPNIESISENKKVGKVQIPRITNNRHSPKVPISSSVSRIIIMQPVPQISEATKNQGKQKTKYKPIQPKPSSNNTTPTPSIRPIIDQESDTSNSEAKLTGEHNKEFELTEDKTIKIQCKITTISDGISTNDSESVGSCKRTLENKEIEDKTIGKRSRTDDSTCPEECSTNTHQICSLYENLPERTLPKLIECKKSSQELMRNELQINNAVSQDMQASTIENEVVMDYLEGGSASLEQDEELSQYFKETDEKRMSANTTNENKQSHENGQSAQLSQLRQLLEHLNSSTRHQNRSHTLRDILTQPPLDNSNLHSVNKSDLRQRHYSTPEEQKNRINYSTNIQDDMKTNVSKLTKPHKEIICNNLSETQSLPSVELLTGYSLNQVQDTSNANVSSNPDGNNLDDPVPTTASLSVAARRRVSFPTNLIMSAAAETSQLYQVQQLPASQSSVPPSPNTRCRAFNFMPISPHPTPVPEAAQNIGKNVTLSQPPSASASPFVSPRSTPNPHCRSRHNSGQALSSSYATTPRSTPYPPSSEQSSNINSPFISPHPTPIPFSRSRHNSNQNIQRTIPFSTNQISPNNHGSILNCQSRSRHSSGAAMALMSPRSAPMSPMNYIIDPDNGCQNHFTMPTVGDTPQMRSRHNSNSSIPPISPRSAPLSPMAQVSLNLADVSRNEVMPLLSNMGNILQPSSLPDQDSNPSRLENCVDWPSTNEEYISSAGNNCQLNSWIGNSSMNNDPNGSVRQRHASMGATVHHMPSHATIQSVYDENLGQEVNNLLQNASSEMLQQRSQSVPLQQMIQTMLQQNQANPIASDEINFDQSYSASSIDQSSFPQPIQASTATSEPSSFSVLPDHSSDEQFISHKEFNHYLNSQSPEVNDDLQITLEDLRDCDNDYSKFAQALEQQFNTNHDT